VTSSPLHKGFEYRVRLAVSIPLAWGEFLRDVAAHHYDYKCRESAKAGVVNALCNTACDGEWPSSYPVEWSDLDLLAKIMEQARYHVVNVETSELLAAINAWIRQTKAQITARTEALSRWDAEQVSP
jgi:hypothetical protein